MCNIYERQYLKQRRVPIVKRISALVAMLALCGLLFSCAKAPLDVAAPDVLVEDAIQEDQKTPAIQDDTSLDVRDESHQLHASGA